MIFRIILLTISLSIMSLFSEYYSLGMIGLFWILCIVLPTTLIRHKQWKKILGNIEHKSLSFGIKSIKIQKQNFRMIDWAFSKYKHLAKFLKQISILFDDIHVKRTDPSSIKSNNNDYTTDITYSHILGNVHYKHDK